MKIGNDVPAIVTVRFLGVVDGEIHPRWHEVGSTVTGDLAREAIIAGWAEIPKQRQSRRAPEAK